MNIFPSEWFHGSPLRLDLLRAGSTITPLRDLARVFSHKPPVVSIDDSQGKLILLHNGSQPGWLYRVVEVTPEDVYPHPRSSMPAGMEWLTKVDLRLELIGPTEPRPDEYLSDEDIARLRG
jgi:hypothetical protein